MSQPPARTQVLIVGAGPTGLVLALWLTHLGVAVRIVDKSPQAGQASRAVAVQARVLELYRPLGLDQAVLAGAHRVAAANFWVRNRRVARAPLGAIGQDLSPYPYVTLYPQDEHERMLEAALAERGVQVERGVEVEAFTQSTDGITATLAGQPCAADYLAGCDGAHSMVRHEVTGAFPGGTYEHLFYVADIQGRGPALNGELHIDLDTDDFLAIFPLDATGRARLIGTVRDADADPASLTFADASHTAIAGMGVEVDQVHWFSAYRVHHRVAQAFRKGRAFLVGDAAHIHSPVGGQGMNTGIGDAINLAWKLAAVMHGRAGDDLLNTYEPERRSFALRLVATTDRAFTAATSPTVLARFLRTAVVPMAAAVGARLGAVRRLMFRTVSQIGVGYPDGQLSGASVGAATAGMRMPWVKMQAGDNLEGLRRRTWHVQVHGDPKPGLQAWCDAVGVRLHAYPWTEAAQRAGLVRDAAHLLRPDGHLATASRDGATADFDSYFAERE